MEGKKLWELIENTDMEDAIRGRLDMEEAPEEDIIKAIDGNTKAWVIDEYFLWNGHGTSADDIRWLLEFLEIMPEYEWNEKTEQ